MTKHEQMTQTAFRKGQDDARDNRPRDNPYPTQSDWHDPYEQGYDSEYETMYG
ncbi:hypothetical protein NGM99_13780 [Mesorhizobium sp. RP14(2022)]|uniref:Uncharacterized protein n=1 Tax=Mesorhizobium liriopis TaxID=2953882 RepID=A0ABT1C7Q0_9HYPH|nr:hypothetical protein [Mesorhizobium liriopis]MCO6050849.1 hypothetical protein [Mesorhizobium liriopis]